MSTTSERAGLLFLSLFFPLLAATGCIAFSLWALRKVRIPKREDELLSSVFQARTHSDIERLLRVAHAELAPQDGPAPAQSWVHEQLREVGYRTAIYSVIPTQCGRVSLAFGTAVAVWSFAKGMKESMTQHLATGAILAFAIGLCGALFCFYLGRRAKVAAIARREKWQRLRRRLGS